MKKIAKYIQLTKYLYQHSTDSVNYWDGVKTAAYLDSVYEVSTINTRSMIGTCNNYYKIVELSKLDVELIKRLATVIDVKIGL